MTLMAKRARRPSDPTLAAALDGGRTVAAPAEGGQTSAVPNTRPTDAVELAWSSGDVLGDENDHEIPAEAPRSREPANVSQSWGATLRIAALLIAGGLVLAGGIVLGRSTLTSGSSPTSAAPTSGATSATSSATAAAPVSITSTLDQDNRFTDALNENGIKGLDPQQAVTTGKQVCQDMYRGVKLEAEVDAFRAAQQKNLDLATRADDFVKISINAYCPQYAPH